MLLGSRHFQSKLDLFIDLLGTVADLPVVTIDFPVFAFKAQPRTADLHSSRNHQFLGHTIHLQFAMNVDFVSTLLLDLGRDELGNRILLHIEEISRLQMPRQLRVVGVNRLHIDIDFELSGCYVVILHRDGSL
jgi:hypothetical protein